MGQTSSKPGKCPWSRHAVDKTPVTPIRPMHAATSARTTGTLGLQLSEIEVAIGDLKRIQRQQEQQMSSLTAQISDYHEKAKIDMRAGKENTALMWLSMKRQRENQLRGLEACVSTVLRQTIVAEESNDLQTIVRVTKQANEAIAQIKDEISPERLQALVQEVQDNTRTVEEATGILMGACESDPMAAEIAAELQSLKAELNVDSLEIPTYIPGSEVREPPKPRTLAIA